MSSRLQLRDLRLDGFSLAGDSTWFRVHPPGLAFDAGRGAQALAGARDLFLTHGHLDHALGVPFVLSYRTRHQGERTRVFCPRPLVERLAAFVAAAAALEGSPYEAEIVGLEAGDRVEVGRGLAVEAFATPHVVASLGYHLLRRRERLAERFRGLPRAEIIRLRQEGEAICDTVEDVRLSYCGDSAPSVFELEPRLYESPVLLVECTFMTPELRDKGLLYGHLHLEDLAERADRFRNESIVLHHLSRRHRRRDLRRAVVERLGELAERVWIWGDTLPAAAALREEES